MQSMLLGVCGLAVIDSACYSIFKLYKKCVDSMSAYLLVSRFASFREAVGIFLLGENNYAYN
jgi:hypothetical protein